MSDVRIGSNFDGLFSEIVSKINTNPEHVCSPRSWQVREIIAPTLVLTDPRARILANPGRDVNYGFGVGEFLWYWAGRKDLKSMLYYNKRMKDFSDDGDTLNSAYGYRIKTEEYGRYYTSQWQACKTTLLNDPDSRRALLLINRPQDQAVAVEEGSKDVPCTLSLQFFIRDRKLILHAHMRSNDAFWGLTYDLFSFTLFQECMLLELRKEGMKDLELGEYIHTAGSLHIYERHFEMADRVVKAYLDNEFQPAAPMEPIDLEGLALLVEQEEALRDRKVAQLDEAQFSGGTRWMCQQLNAHRRKRDKENGK